MTHVVAPDRLIASWWSVMTGLLVAGAAWLVLDSGGAWPFLALLAASLLVFGWFAVQAALPGMVTLRVDDAGMAGRFLWRRIDVPWADVHLLRVDSLVGDSLIEVTVISDGGTRLIPLPVGTSLGRLHDALGATIGRHGAGPMHATTRQERP